LNYLSFLVWRLVTGLFVHSQLLELVFSVMSYIPSAIKVEKDIGTVRMVHRFLTLGFLINTIFTAIVVPIGINQMSVGLWPLLFADIVCECMKTPEMERG
jgi:membrane associated rhomboid family serine protease